MAGANSDGGERERVVDSMQHSLQVALCHELFEHIDAGTMQLTRREHADDTSANNDYIRQENSPLLHIA